MGVCYIVGAGEFTRRGFAPGPEDFVLAADGGYVALKAIGVKPDLLLGDFDSLPAVPADVPVERHPTHKDDTDTGLALRRGWDMGFRAFALYGCGGGRADHLLANFQNMCRLSRMGARICLIARDYDAWAITNGALTLPPCPAGTGVSVFCHGERAEGVTLEGLVYPLANATLTGDMPLGVSNQIADGNQSAVARVKSGTLLVFLLRGETACNRAADAL